ncbi:shikimate dehydrogenase [Eoetvoesiella caeni]
MTPSLLRFAVVGNPIAHSRSPAIHQEFGRQLGIALSYETLLAPVEGFAATVAAFFGEGGSGLNITLPFKEEAYSLASADLSDRARLAGAVNTLWMQEGRLHGCNTDGVGLLDDIQRLGVSIAGKRVLLVGAGGAAKGAVYPLLQAQCAALRILNRNAARAHELHAHAAGLLPQFAQRLSAGGLDEGQGQWDIVINATSSSLSSQAPSLPGVAYASGALAYDMVYAAQPTAFMQQAKAAGAQYAADGLGMLVAQAAASFFIWHGRAPDINPVLAMLRRQLDAA